MVVKNRVFGTKKFFNVVGYLNLKTKLHACRCNFPIQIRVLKHRWNCSSKKCHWMNLNNKENTDHPNTNVNLFAFLILFFGVMYVLVCWLKTSDSETIEQEKFLFPAFDATFASIHSFFSFLSVFTIRRGLFFNELSGFTN